MSFDSLTPPPQEVKSQTRKVLLWLFVAAVALTSARWYYGEVYLPQQPLDWRKFQLESLSAAAETGPPLMLFVRNKTPADNLALLDQIEQPKLRKLIRKLEFRTQQWAIETVRWETSVDELAVDELAGDPADGGDPVDGDDSADGGDSADGKPSPDDQPAETQEPSSGNAEENAEQQAIVRTLHEKWQVNSVPSVLIVLPPRRPEEPPRTQVFTMEQAKEIYPFLYEYRYKRPPPKGAADAERAP